MKRLRSLADKIVRFAKGEDGPTTVEYAVMLMVIVLGCVLAIRHIGQSSNDTYKELGNTLSNSSASSSGGANTP